MDSGWYGTIVVETEGTNEHLGELQERCGKGVFPPKLTPMGQPRLVKNPDALKVWRILREKRCVLQCFVLLQELSLTNPSLSFIQSTRRDLDSDGLRKRENKLTNADVLLHVLLSGTLDLRF